jgi:hypothetical protein
MKKIIHQLEISASEPTKIKLLEGAKVLDVAFPPHYGIVLSVMTDYFETKEESAKATVEERTFVCYGVGEVFEKDETRYIGTVYNVNRNIGYHVHEVVVPVNSPDKKPGEIAASNKHKK